ncbi:Protein kinase domain protein [Cryptosporidium meleagridis]|uniref:Protein kinase domain protein n=1 Tax=Cryptosporidium meleagridis TaxID=93969 RepID=A0A2P4Z5I0_9CRYT|nr:Protein kinase domain protein [Cryptosporidium meleagridis]
MNFKKYELIKEIGSGTFGRVWMAKDFDSNEFVAIKRRPKWQNIVRYVLKSLFLLINHYFISREVEAMEAVKGERGIVQIKGCFYSLTPGGIIMQNIVMPLMTKSLGVFIRENRALRKQNSSHRISPELVKSLSFQIVNGLAALHSSGYTHRDFKPDNILLMDMDDSERKFPTINICDLGSSKKLLNNSIHMPYVVSRFYRAPELLLGSCDYNEKIDIWGCILAELLALDPIFVGKYMINKIVLKVNFLGRCPDKYRDNKVNYNKQGVDEPFQILKIIEVLGNPNSNDIELFKKTVPKSINKVLDECFLASEVSSISWLELFEGFFTEEEKLLVEIISNCIQWNPTKRPSVS